MVAGQFQYCPTPDCGYMFDPHPENPLFRCPKCSKSYCLACKIPNHNGMSCDQYKSEQEKKRIAGLIENINNQDETAFINLMRGQGGQQCPGCRSLVFRNGGCSHMSCRCGTNFCIACASKDWRNCGHYGRV